MPTILCSRKAFYHILVPVGKADFVRDAFEGLVFLLVSLYQEPHGCCMTVVHLFYEMTLIRTCLTDFY